VQIFQAEETRALMNKFDRSNGEQATSANSR